MQDILENFEFRNQIPRLSKADALGTLISKFLSPDINLSPNPVPLGDGSVKQAGLDIPRRVSADPAYQNARKNSDKQNARIKHDKALARVMTDVLKDDMELFRQFMDNESFRGWLAETVFGLTYE